MSYFKSLRFKLMLLAVITGTAVSFACIAVSVVMSFRIRDMAASAYLGAVAGADSAIVQAVQNIKVDLSWLVWVWVIAWVVIFGCLFVPVTISIKRIISPIRTAASYADELAEGNVYIEVIKNRSDEIGVLQESFQKLVGSINRQSELIQKISDGDLTAEVTLLSEKDVMSLALQKMVDNLGNMFGNINTSADQVSTGAKQIADGAQSLAEGAMEQSALIEELSGSIADIADKTKANAGMADKAAKLADSIKDNAEKGSRQMDDMIAAVNAIKEASNSINKVIKVIDDIAFQTNILALNAAVEAARAGQHGKGFAVVAEEVRNLAAKSAEAAKDTGSLIENSIEKANLGVLIADETAKSLSGIVSGIKESSLLVNEIAASSGEQSTGIEQINTGIEKVAQVVHQNSATAQESAAASQEMSSQSVMLQELVSYFKFKDEVTSGYSLPSHSRSAQKTHAIHERAGTPVVGSAGFGKY